MGIFWCAGNEKIIELLLQNNATNVNAVDNDGHTALDAVLTVTEGTKLTISAIAVVNQRITLGLTDTKINSY